MKKETRNHKKHFIQFKHVKCSINLNQKKEKEKHLRGVAHDGILVCVPFFLIMKNEHGTSGRYIVLSLL